MRYMLMYRSPGSMIGVGLYNNEGQARRAMMNYLDRLHIKSYYQRYWGDNPKICDFGSHTSFFYLYDRKPNA